MDALRKLQHEFLGYLLDDSATAIVARVQSTTQRSAEQRLAFYGHGYGLRLKEALSTDYERLHSYLGDELFDSLMQQYIAAYPSHHTSLRYFGQHMPELVTQLEPFSLNPEIVEIARIEQAFADSFDAADSAIVRLEQLTQLTADVWPNLRLRFHAAVQLLPQQNNSFQIWRALASEATPPEVTADTTTWLIWRQDLVSRYRALEAAELAVLNAAIAGHSFADICEALLEHFDEDETPQRVVTYLQQWINDQMVTTIAES